jgi:hypothetical protein
MPLSDFIRVLELAVSPAILVSGIGLLLLSMTNRFGRVIDRARILMPRLGGESGERTERVNAQMRILARRARTLRTAITAAVVSLLAAVLLVAGLFAAAVCGSEGIGVVAALAACFVASMAGLIAALALFLYELNLSLQALWLELPADCRGHAPAAGRADSAGDQRGQRRDLLAAAAAGLRAAAGCPDRPGRRPS